VLLFVIPAAIFACVMSFANRTNEANVDDFVTDSMVTGGLIPGSLPVVSLDNLQIISARTSINCIFLGWLLDVLASRIALSL
jgi:hypothetical protein